MTLEVAGGHGGGPASLESFVPPAHASEVFVNDSLMSPTQSGFSSPLLPFPSCTSSMLLSTWVRRLRPQEDLHVFKSFQIRLFCDMKHVDDKLSVIHQMSDKLHLLLKQGTF